MTKRLHAGSMLLLAGLLYAGPVAAQIYQWTDQKGVIHFTDDPEQVPESVRSSGSLIIRGDTTRKNDEQPSAKKDEEPPTERPPAANEPPKTDEPRAAEPERKDSEPAVGPQGIREATIIVVNGGVFRKTPRHGRDPRTRGFTPSFNDRRYIHPHVFDGGSRQYIRP